MRRQNTHRATGHSIFKAALLAGCALAATSTAQAQVAEGEQPTTVEDEAPAADQNLAESLQRIPGISITRDAGEGRAITVRGLSSQFTRVRVNGLETVATSTDGASAN